MKQLMILTLALVLSSAPSLAQRPSQAPPADARTTFSTDQTTVRPEYVVMVTKQAPAPAYASQPQLAVSQWRLDLVLDVGGRASYPSLFFPTEEARDAAYDQLRTLMRTGKQAANPTLPLPKD